MNKQELLSNIKNLKNGDLLNLKLIENQRLYCWKYQTIIDKYLVLKNNGEGLRVPIEDITELAVIHQPPTCKGCNQVKMGLYEEDGLCTVCHNKALEPVKKKRKTNDIDLNKITIEVVK